MRRLVLALALVAGLASLAACKVSYDYSTPNQGGGYTGSQDSAPASE